MDEFFDRWRAFTKRKGLSVPAKLTDDRRKKIRKRLREPGWFDEFLAACEKLPVPGDGWQPDIDWIIRNNENVTKLIEGKYDWRGEKANGKTALNQGVVERAMERYAD